MSKFTYIDAIKLLGNYSGNQIYYLKGAEEAARFLSGAWNRKNVDAVEAVLAEHDPFGLQEGKLNGYTEDAKITALLNDLKNQLTRSGTPINPHGALSRCIDKIQGESRLAIINVYKINREIKKENPVQEAEQDKELPGNQTFTYIDAIILLGQYSGNQPYYAKGWEAASRFFSGAWNRKNVDAVEAVLAEHDPSGLQEGKFNDYKNPQPEQAKIEDLLKDLKNQLITAGKEINSEGSLVKLINTIQTQSKTKIIDIDDLNAEIKQNTYSHGPR